MAIHFPKIPATYRNIPKTGTTSFRFWARDNIQDCIILDSPDMPYNMQHLSLDQIKELWPDYGTTFTFVRNPYARMVSIFHHIGQDAEARIKQRMQGGGTKEKHGVKQIELDAVPIEIDIKILSVYKKGFENWVHSSEEEAFNGSLLSLLNQKETQMRWLNNVVPDIVIKIESVNDNFNILQDLLGCNVPFPHVNTSQHADYRDYYTPATKKIVGDLFKEDFETFNYDFWKTI